MKEDNKKQKARECNKKSMKRYRKTKKGQEKIKKYGKKYYKKNKIKLLNKSKEYGKKYYQRAEIKAKRKLNRKKYLSKQEVKNKINKNNKNKRIINKNFVVKERLRKLIQMALKSYTKTGKIQSSNKYGIDYKAIIEHLKPFPKNIKLYHIDHIKPLCSFNLEYKEEIKKAFAPENHQWLTIEENLKKGSKIINNIKNKCPGVKNDR